MTDPQPPRLATSRCIFGHRWTVWERQDAIVLNRVTRVQCRECTLCGKQQAELIRVQV